MQGQEEYTHSNKKYAFVPTLLQVKLPEEQFLYSMKTQLFSSNADNISKETQQPIIVTRV